MWPALRCTTTSQQQQNSQLNMCIIILGMERAAFCRPQHQLIVVPLVPTTGLVAHILLHIELALSHGSRHFWGAHTHSLLVAAQNNVVRAQTDNYSFLGRGNMPNILLFNVAPSFCGKWQAQLYML